MKIILSLLLLAAAAAGAAVHAAEIVVRERGAAPPLEFALRQLDAALKKNGDGIRRISAASAEAANLDLQTNGVSGLNRDGFRITRSGSGPSPQLRVEAETPLGLMYGVLELAEKIRFGISWKDMPERVVKPAFEFRAIKFNLPFAAYRTSAAIEQHQETCKDLKFWEAFLDMMAENRFNTLTLWSLHPFHYLTVPKDFPEARTFTEQEMAEYHALFAGIFKMAKDRGIETYLVNWNTFVSPAFAKARHVAEWSEGWNHFGPGTTNALVMDYTRECVTQVIDEYPDLTGLGITLGERMGEQTPEERRDWLAKTFFEGIARANRPVKFLYRAPLSADTQSGGTTSLENDRRTRAQIEGLSRNIAGPVYVEFKHNWSHAHSSPDLFIVHGGKLSDAYWNPSPTRHKVVWTMRNEDFYILRWGQPDFVRQFVKTQAKDYVGGAIVGSECYIPALDYFTKPGVLKDWHYAFERQWLFYAVWGKLLYDAATPDAEFESLLAQHFGRERSAPLLEAWKLASKVPLAFASFHQGRADGTIYTEGHSSWRDNGPRKYFDIDSFITHPVLDTKRYVNIADFVKMNGAVPPGVESPLMLADRLQRDGAEAIRLVGEIRRKGNISPALDCELADIEAWSAYGDFFAEKLRGGCALALARRDHDAQQQAAAVASLEKALAHWKRLAELGNRFNQLPVLSNSEKPFSWASLTPEVEKDVVTAREALAAPHP